jgi:hypothetical protein
MIEPIAGSSASPARAFFLLVKTSNPRLSWRQKPASIVTDPRSWIAAFLPERQCEKDGDSGLRKFGSGAQVVTDRKENGEGVALPVEDFIGLQIRS